MVERPKKIAAATEDDIVLDADGYVVRCVVCGKKATPDGDGPPPFHTFSLGYDEKSAFVFGVVALCDEHKDYDSVMPTLLRRIEQILGRGWAETETVNGR